MLYPSVATKFTFFYAVGNTPAVNLAKHVPNGRDAAILSLGCGDLRNLLYTAYMQRGLPNRKLDFTCNDINASIIARNVILLTLIIDNDEAVAQRESDLLWDIYYHMRLGVEVAQRLHEHVKALASQLASLQAWRSSKYGQLVHFCDVDTFRDVSKTIQRMAEDAAAVVAGEAAPIETKLKKGVEAAQRVAELRGCEIGKKGGFRIITGTRSAAPCGLAALPFMPENFDAYWETGEALSAETQTNQAIKVPNPMFASLMTDSCILHYGSDPVLGFHLATAFAPLKSDSPLKSTHEEDRLAVSAAAKMQFSVWISALRGLFHKRVVAVRMIVSDALACCHTLQHARASGQPSAGWYRRLFDPKPLVLSDAYGTNGSAPKMFDIIDSSNLSDHIGTLNVLIATAPLLKAEPWATVNTELLLKIEGHMHLALSALLCGDSVTMCLLLGLLPIQYWTNSKCESHVDEFLLAMKPSRGSPNQLHYRIHWKRNTELSGAASDVERLVFDPDDLVEVLLGVYREMHIHERLPQHQNPTSIGLYPFHRGSFASFLKLVKHRVKVDWDGFCDILVGKIGSLKNLMLNDHHKHELLVQLHLQGIWTSPVLSIAKLPALAPFKAWQSVPLSVAVSLVVPRRRMLDLFKDGNSPNLLLASITAFIDVAGKRHLFSDVHFAWGSVQPSARPKAGDGSFSITEDEECWNGSSPLIATFVIPTKLLDGCASGAELGLWISPSDLASRRLCLPFLGWDATLFKTQLKKKEGEVFLSTYGPAHSRHRVDCGGVGSRMGARQASSSSRKLLVSIQMKRRKVFTITGHIDIDSDEGRKLLQDRVPIAVDGTLHPSKIRLRFAETSLTLNMDFPVPVDVNRAKMRIARTSGYIEVIVPPAVPPAASALQSYIFPSILSRSGIVTSLNMPYLSLDQLPVLDLKQTSRLDWLVLVGSMQLSVRQTEIRESATRQQLVGPDAVKIDLKESIFEMMKIFMKFQGGQTVITLSRGKPFDDGVHLLFLISALRLDADAGSVVLDGAVLPLEMKHMTSGAYRGFLPALVKSIHSDMKISDEELRAWKHVLPAMAERCRTWSHRPSCEYSEKGATVPLSLEAGQQVLCSCGYGKLPEAFKDHPPWHHACQRAVRVAISPTFAVPLVEDCGILSPASPLHPSFAGLTIRAEPAFCEACGRTDTGTALKNCLGCRKVKYCSVKCQKKDWKKHREACQQTADA